MGMEEIKSKISSLEDKKNKLEGELQKFDRSAATRLSEEGLEKVSQLITETIASHPERREELGAILEKINKISQEIKKIDTEIKVLQVLIEKSSESTEESQQQPEEIIQQSNSNDDEFEFSEIHNDEVLSEEWANKLTLENIDSIVVNSDIAGVNAYDLFSFYMLSVDGNSGLKSNGYDVSNNVTFNKESFSRLYEVIKTNKNDFLDKYISKLGFSGTEKEKQISYYNTAIENIKNNKKPKDVIDFLLKMNEILNKNGDVKKFTIINQRLSDLLKKAS